MLKLLLSAAALIGTVTSSPIPRAVEARGTSELNVAAQCPDYCAGTNINATLLGTYICGDYRLGPTTLPTALSPVFDLIDNYDRFGGLCPGAFLAKWYNATKKTYTYPIDLLPNNNGYQFDVNNQPIKGNVNIPPGTLLDRFGGETGTFLSPQGAPYNQRALPPWNLNTPAANPKYPYDYFVYRVVTPLLAQTGPILPWFGQPGLGVQFELFESVASLLDKKVIQRVNLDELYLIG